MERRGGERRRCGWQRRKKPATAGMVCRLNGRRARRRQTCESNSRRRGSLHLFHPRQRMKPVPPARMNVPGRRADTSRFRGESRELRRITITSRPRGRTQKPAACRFFPCASRDGRHAPSGQERILQLDGRAHGKKGRSARLAHGDAWGPCETPHLEDERVELRKAGESAYSPSAKKWIRLCREPIPHSLVLM